MVELPPRSLTGNHSFSAISLSGVPGPLLSKDTLSDRSLLETSSLHAGQSRDLGFWKAFPPLSGMAFCPDPEAGRDSERV